MKTGYTGYVCFEVVPNFPQEVSPQSQASHTSTMEGLPEGYHGGKATGIPGSRVDSLEVLQYEGLSCTCSARLSKR